VLVPWLFFFEGPISFGLQAHLSSIRPANRCRVAGGSRCHTCSEALITMEIILVDRRRREFRIVGTDDGSLRAEAVDGKTYTFCWKQMPLKTINSLRKAEIRGTVFISELQPDGEPAARKDGWQFVGSWHSISDERRANIVDRMDALELDMWVVPAGGQSHRPQKTYIRRRKE